MRTLTQQEIKAVSGAFNWDGCHWLSPVDAIQGSGILGGGVGAAFGTSATSFGGVTAIAGSQAAMTAGATWGAAAGVAGFGGYNTGVAINKIFGRCD